jgi:predicted RNA-binding Zn-ribbon protein involved in translation (DUF1610 family)
MHAQSVLLAPLADVCARIDALRGAVRELYYALVLWPHACVTCGNNALVMLHEGACRCQDCGHVFDPTLAFTRCAKCDGRPRRRWSRYACQRCGRDVPSPFLFDGKVFDAAYYRQKMRQSRARRMEQAQPRPPQPQVTHCVPLARAPIDLAAVPGLEAALALLTAAGPPERLPPAHGLMLDRYERHLRAAIGPEPVALVDLPPLQADRRLDRIWCFVAAVFLAHAGVLALEQVGEHVLISQHETH